MGIPGILKEIGRGERIALSKLAVEHIEKTGRPFRIAIDIAIWQFQNQAGRGGANPALRTLYYRLLKLLALPIHPIFVYDGKSKPLTKRNKTVTAYGTCLPNEMSKKLIQAFRFPYHTAPGEAEAECALLQRKGIVDAVLSQDVDTLMFGSTMTLRDWSKEGTRGNKTASHVNVLRAEETQTKTGLDSDGMILVALLSGGDYNTEGVPGFGPSLACEIAKARFSTELLQLLRHGDANVVKEWRERLQYELETNESGYFKKRHKTVKIPENFPDPTILGYYTDPAVSSPEQLQKIRVKCAETWDTDIEIPLLRIYVAEKFEWMYKTGMKKLIRTLAPSLLANRLRRGLTNTTITSPDNIKERRIHFTNDGLPELRLEVIPNDIVGLNVEDEEDNPAFTEEAAGQDKDLVLDMDEANDPDLEEVEDPIAPPSPSKTRKSPRWDPAAPQKIWVPETIAKMGIAAFIEAWEQKQRDILADSKKFATRKCPKPKAMMSNTGMKPGALDGFFASSKPGLRRDLQSINISKSTGRSNLRDMAPVNTPRTPLKRVLKPLADESSPTIDQYFNRSTIPLTAGLDQRKDGMAGIEFPPRARLSGLNLYSPEARSSDAERPLVPDRSTSGRKHSRPTTADSTEIHDIQTHDAPATSTTGNPSSHGSREEVSYSDSIVISSPSQPNRTAKLPPPPRSALNQLQKSVTQRPRRRIRNSPSPVTKSEPDALVPQVPTGPTTTVKSHFPTNKAIVMSRDSLPGTWKQIDDEEIMVVTAGPHQRRLPRVSVLDLIDG